MFTEYFEVEPITSIFDVYYRTEKTVHQYWPIIRRNVVTVAKWSWVILFWSTATAFALGMIARDIWNWGQPKFMGWVDGIVERYLDDDVPALTEETQEELSDDTALTDDYPDGTPHYVAMGFEEAVAVVPVMNEVDPCKMGIRELRPYAIRQGIKGAGRMTKKQILELMGV